MSHLFSIKHDINSNEFKSPDALEQGQYKPLLIDWLCRRYDYANYQHSFKDRFMTFSIWGDQLSISFDFRCEDQAKLFDALPAEIKGCKQQGTGKMVNLKHLYFKIPEFIKVDYPEITKQELFKTDKSKDNDGDDFYVYNHRAHLADGTILLFSNQKLNEPLDMKFIYPTYINTRAFLRYLKGINNSNTTIKTNLGEVK